VAATLVLDGLARGLTPAQIVERYPALREADVRNCLKLAAWLMREAAVDWQQLDADVALDMYDEFMAWEAVSDEAWGAIEP